MLIAACTLASGCSATPAQSQATAAPATSVTSDWTPVPTTAIPTATPTRQPLEPSLGWIAYQAITPQRDGAHAVHLVRPDGTGAFFALDMIPGGEQLHPDWSLSGTQLVLDVSDATQTPDIWVADITTWKARKVVDCAAPCLWVQEPAWAPDGNRIAYQRHLSTAAGETSQIEILDTGSGATSIVFKTGTDRGVFAPRWSPDGKSLVFEETKAAGDTLVGVSLEVLDVAKPGVTHTIVPVEKMANNSDWSPDGELIAFSAPMKGGEPGGALSDIWVVRPDGAGARRVTTVAASGGSAVQPTFTPDGAHIIFKLTDEAVAASDAMALVPITGGDPNPATGSIYTYGWHPRVRPTP